MELELVYEVLDLQVVDVNGRRCGRVDDIEMDLSEGRVPALLIGRGVWPDRFSGQPMRRLTRRMIGEVVMGKNLVRVPWREIDSITATVNLRRPAEEMGLAGGDLRLADVVGRLLMIPERKPK